MVGRRRCWGTLVDVDPRDFCLLSKETFKKKIKEHLLGILQVVELSFLHPAGPKTTAMFSEKAAFCFLAMRPLFCHRYSSLQHLPSPPPTSHKTEVTWSVGRQMNA